MRTFLLRRLLQTIPLLFGISALTFLMLQLAPGDFLATMAENPQISTATLDAMRHRFGLDQSWWVQYLLYLKNIFLHLDFGESFARHQPVFAVLRTGLANTLLLATAAAPAKLVGPMNLSSVTSSMISRNEVSNVSRGMTPWASRRLTRKASPPAPSRRDRNSSETRPNSAAAWARASACSMTRASRSRAGNR